MSIRTKLILVGLAIALLSFLGGIGLIYSWWTNRTFEPTTKSGSYGANRSRIKNGKLETFGIAAYHQFQAYEGVWTDGNVWANTYSYILAQSDAPYILKIGDESIEATFQENNFTVRRAIVPSDFEKVVDPIEADDEAIIVHLFLANKIVSDEQLQVLVKAARQEWVTVRVWQMPWKNKLTSEKMFGAKVDTK